MIRGIQETYDCIVQVSGRLEGGMADWPANIQDGIWVALMRKSKEERQALSILSARCDFDRDTGWFIHVVAVGPWRMVS